MDQRMFDMKVDYTVYYKVDVTKANDDYTLLREMII